MDFLVDFCLFTCLFVVIALLKRHVLFHIVECLLERVCCISLVSFNSNVAAAIRESGRGIRDTVRAAFALKRH